MAFIDFDEVKSRFTFADVIAKLELKLSGNGPQWRGECPKCKGGERSLLITEKRGYFCFTNKAGGDVIGLTAHIRDCSAKEAADWLIGKAQPPPEDKKFQPLPYLDSSHEAVVAIGFNTEFAAKHGIGYAPKGIMRGTVAVPFRDEQGNLLGYIGIDSATLPGNFT